MTTKSIALCRCLACRGNYMDEAEYRCTCGVSEPDEFGNRDLIENPDCPVHGEENA